MNPVVSDLDTRGKHDGVTARTIRLIYACIDGAALMPRHTANWIDRYRNIDFLGSGKGRSGTKIISATTIATVLRGGGFGPAPRRIGPTWTQFLRLRANAPRRERRSLRQVSHSVGNDIDARRIGTLRARHEYAQPVDAKNSREPDIAQRAHRRNAEVAAFLSAQLLPGETVIAVQREGLMVTDRRVLFPWPGNPSGWRSDAIAFEEVAGAPS